jgi:hypothetical protein
LIIGFKVKGLKRAFLIAFKEVRIVKKACYNKRTFSGRKKKRQFKFSVNKTI